MTKQETFDKVARALIRQGRPSVIRRFGGSVSCKYRDGEGNKCAAGHLIPDGKYVPSLEGWGLNPSHHNSPVCAIISEEGHDLLLVGDLQGAHDDAATALNFLTKWREKMVNVAVLHGLDAAVLQEAA